MSRKLGSTPVAGTDQEKVRKLAKVEAPEKRETK